MLNVGCDGVGGGCCEIALSYWNSLNDERKELTRRKPGPESRLNV